MKMLSAIITFVVLTVSLLACASPRPSGFVADGEAAIRKLVVAWDQRFNEGDILALSAQYAEDAISMPFNAPTVVGREGIKKEFQNLFDQNEAKHETMVDEILISDGWSIERSRYKMVLKQKATGREVVETGRHVMCRKLTDGNWLIVWEIWNSDQPTG